RTASVNAGCNRPRGPATTASHDSWAQDSKNQRHYPERTGLSAPAPVPAVPGGAVAASPPPAAVGSLPPAAAGPLAPAAGPLPPAAGSPFRPVDSRRPGRVGPASRYAAAATSWVPAAISRQPVTDHPASGPASAAPAARPAIFRLAAVV